MTYTYIRLLVFAVLISPVFSLGLSAQDGKFWTGQGTEKPLLLRSEEVNIATSAAYFLAVDRNQLHQLVEESADGQFYLTLPNPQGRSVRFRLEPYEMMEKGLSKRFPSLRTFRGKAVDDLHTRIHFSFSSTFFQATVFDGKSTWYVDAYSWPARDIYQSYYKSACEEESYPACSVQERGEQKASVSLRENLGSIQNVIREYRLAVSVSYTYYNYFGRDIEKTMAGIVATVNRVNMIYERDLGVRLILVEDNEQLIVTDPLDPIFTLSFQEDVDNQEHIDDIIGKENYDIGHVFMADGSGGYATPGVCNDNLKANGVTGLAIPQGDAFDIDFVAHEIGHQFGANHTFNGINASCGGPWYPFTAFEPGAGTTIMAYAGLCGVDNITPGSDAYFHGGSIVEINNFLINAGSTCANFDTTNNKAPQIREMEDGKYIPILTPFELDASVMDEDKDNLLYLWEQVDRGPQLALGTYGGGNEPLFRSFPPSTSTHRVFPQLQDLLANRLERVELLPNTTRDLNFQFTVRDQEEDGPTIAWSKVRYFVDGNTGPFRLDNLAQLRAGANHKLEWEVNGTDEFPVSADSVVLLLSTDGGVTFPITLDTFANTGLGVFFLPPDIQSNSARLKLKPVNNIFFDISDVNQAIQFVDEGQSFVEIIDANQGLIFCGSDSIRLEFYYNAFENGQTTQASIQVKSDGFSNTIDTIAGENKGVITLFGGTNLPTGLYPVELIINTVSAADTLLFNIDLQGQDALISARAIFPEPNARDIAIQPQFSWESLAQVEEYQVELAEDPSFAEVLYRSPVITNTSYQLTEHLSDTTTYFWRINGFNNRCGTSGYSEVNTFTTEQIYCKAYRSDDLPVPFDALPFIQSSITVPDNFTVLDVNVKQIRGTFADPNALSFKLRSPEGPIIDLLTKGGNCVEGSSFSFSVDDEAETAFVPCPNDIGAEFTPVTPLSTYQGQNTLGRWSLTIFDNGSDGALEDWVLELCFGAPAGSIVSSNRNTFRKVNTVKVYPNPLTSILNFESEEGPINEIRIADMLGRIVLTQKNISSRYCTIPVDGWSKGTYIYQVQLKNGGVQVGKLLR